MKQYIKNILFYFLVSLGCISFCFLIGRAVLNVDCQVIGKSTMSDYTIILDAGHGGNDGGAVGKNGVMEKDINLAITNKLYDMLFISGFKVKMVRDADISIHDEGSNSIHNQKVSDLNNRLKIVNSDDNNILISIHQNNFSDGKYSGAQMFYSEKNPKSKEMASYIKNSFVSLLQPENKREIKPAGKNIFLLYNANVPAVIVECGFLSNDAEAKLLSDDGYQGKVAFAIYCGFLEFFNNCF